MQHGLDGREALLVVVSEQLVQQVDRLWRDEVLVVGVEELGPRLARVPPEDAVEMRVELEGVLVEVIEELVRAENLFK